ncbi:MAG: rRNA maturation RNase YbeY [Clostridia bacterium]|nr:rRNA maturation RNase YbeY [Clostridia bacterium]
MKLHAEIEYDGVEENNEYNDLIYDVINECFKNELMDKLKLYVSITLTYPKVIQKINAKYRGIDKPTDVLSFPMFNKEEIDSIKKDKKNYEEVLGDIIISIPKVKEQAREYGHSFERELAYMCVHGFYHLMGYDHIVESDKVEMRKKEDEVLDKLGIIRKG